MNSEYYFENRSKVKGFALPWPVDFLKDEISISNKILDLGTTFLPHTIFT